ncbi:MAG: BamA/TamA family outer membrane protein, partial [Candidatus Zixiibacteriota bacterium]
FQDGSDSWKRNIERYVSNVNSSALPDSVQQYLIDNGFLDCRVTPGNGVSEDPIRVTFGGRYPVNILIFGGDASDTLLYRGEFDRMRIEPLIDSVLAGLQARGYYLSSLTPTLIIRNGDAIDLHFSLQTGPLMTISTIELEGLDNTNPEFLRKYVPLSPGDTIVPERVRRSANGLRRLDFVALIDEPRIIPDVDYQTAGVRFSFIERTQFDLDGAAGYIPDDNGYFIWHINARARNFLGGGRRAGLLADRRERYKSIFRVYYGQPAFWLGIGEVELNLRTRDYRDQFYEFGLQIAYRQHLAATISINTELGWKNVEPTVKSLRSYASYEASVGFNAGGIEELRSVAGGYAVDWQIQYCGRHYKGDGEDGVGRAVYNDTRSELRLEFTRRLFVPMTNYLKLDFKDIESSEVPLPTSELFLIGGPGSLRGYRNDQYAAQRLVLGTMEWRLFISGVDYIYPFADGVYREWFESRTDGAPMKNSDSHWGYGLGVKIASATRELKLEFSWSREAGFDEPRLGISFSNRF